MPALRLGTFKSKGREFFGAVTASGIIDLSARLGGRYSGLIDLIRARALNEAREAANGKPEFQLSEGEFLPPVPRPEKIICVGINYPERTAEYKDNREKPKYPNLFVRFPDSVVGHERPLV